MIDIRDDVNSLELIQVMEYLDRQGTRNAQIRQGNDCIWVSKGSSTLPINLYFTFKNGQLSTVYVD
jgi:hypothetical protein